MDLTPICQFDKRDAMKNIQEIIHGAFVEVPPKLQARQNGKRSTLKHKTVFL